jgi:hypothetical protein
VDLAVFAAAVRTQIHSAKIVPRPQAACKRVGLHYIAFSNPTVEPTGLASLQQVKKA